MKTLLFFALLFVGYCGNVFSQSGLQYVYDNAGNRISRLVVSTRSFTPYAFESQKDSLDTKMLEASINLYPNPVQTELNVAISELPEGVEWELILYDMSGKTLYRNRFNSLQGTVPMSDFTPGSYLVRLVWEQSQSVWKILKK